MAVTLRNGMSRTTSSTMPMRTSTIHIAQTGQISGLTGNDGKAISALNLGYQGDHNVTRLYVKLWKPANIFVTNYEAVLVFYQESNKISNTISMLHNDTDFYVDIPEGISKTSGNYQVYFILKERIEQSSSGSGGIGAQDDPAYREVFVSASCKGAVNANSGYAFMTDFDWQTDLHDYTRGVIRSSVWTETSPGVYSTEIYLGGLKDGTKPEEIEVNPPALVKVSNKELDARTLTFDAELDASLSYDVLENIEIVYPVIFSVESNFDNLAQKTPIKINHTQATVEIDKAGNNTLGMKLDAYITPIDVSGLINLPASTKKYAIFAQGETVCVCEAKDNYCWIPLCVTNQPGTWNVSFVAKGTSTDTYTNYTYYTGVLKLPVTDNTLLRSDLTTDTVYKAVLDNDAKYLYDHNEYVLYSVAETEEKFVLNNTGTEINFAIGWVLSVAEENAASDLNQIIKNFEEAYEAHNALAERVTNLEGEVTTKTQDLQDKIDDLKEADTQLGTSITAINERIDSLDVTQLTARVDANEEDIEELQTITEDHTTKIADLYSKHTATNARIDTNVVEITNIKENIESLEASDVMMQTDISTNMGKINKMEPEVQMLKGQVATINQTIEPYKGYADLINSETSRATQAETELRNDLEDEVERAEKSEKEISDLLSDTIEDLENLINTVTTDRENIETALAKEVEDRENAVKNEAGMRKEADDMLAGRATALEETSEAYGEQIQGLQTRTNTLETTKTIIRNDYNPGASGQVAVFTIKVLKSEEEYNNLTEKEAGTLYLIQEEEDEPIEPEVE